MNQRRSINNHIVITVISSLGALIGIDDDPHFTSLDVLEQPDNQILKI